jgi:hypothetical protein
MVSLMTDRTAPRGAPIIDLGRGPAVYRCALAAALLAALATIATAAPPFSRDAGDGTSSTAAQQNAVQSLPFDRLDPAGRTKVLGVLNNVTVFRRLPTRTLDCDPQLYDFVVQHPDVLINIWEVLGITQLQLRQTAPDHFRVVESEGTKASMEFLYHSRNTHVAYGEWSYDGPLLAKPIRGRCLGLLRCDMLREPDARTHVTSHLDVFLSVEHGGVELLTKALHPLVVKNADSNFVQTVSFVGSLSRTAEVNPRGMRRLAGRLTHVPAEVREQLADVVTAIEERTTMIAPERAPAQVARHQVGE